VKATNVAVEIPASAPAAHRPSARPA